MGKSNLAQHEWYLKSLQRSIREICQLQSVVYDAFYKTLRSQHELHEKSLEKSVREISEKQNEVYDAFYKALDAFNTTRDMTIKLFVITDDLKTTRLEFEKENSDKESTSWKIRTWWK